MGKIDTSSWKEFSMKDLGFGCYHGKRIKKTDRIKGNTIFLTAGKENCGVAGSIGNKTDIWHNPITVDMFGNTFYHDYDCAGDDNIYAFVNGGMDKYAKMYIAAVIGAKNGNSFSYTNQFRQDDADALSVYLPVTKENLPDFAYMGRYMRSMEDLVNTQLTALQSAQKSEKKKIDTRAWGDFVVGDLFDIHPTQAYKLTNAELLDHGDYPVVVNSAYNNGVGGTTSQHPTENGNMITFSDTVDANTIFYQPNDFVGYPHVQGLYPIGKCADKWTPRCLMFFATVFRQAALARGFDYGNKFRRDIAKTIVVKLPDDAYGDPDWTYMEKYIMSIEQTSFEKIEQIVGGLFDK